MSTRTERRREQTHESLLDALYDVVVEDGLAAATVAAVAERADVAIGTFYNHFDSRDDAIAELSSRHTGRLADLIRDLSAATEDMHDVIDIIARGAIEMLGQDRRWARFMAQVSGSPTWPRGTLSNLLADVVAQGQALGQFDPNGDPRQRGYLIGALFRAAVDLFVQDEESQMDADMLAKAMLAAAGGTRF